MNENYNQAFEFLMAHEGYKSVSLSDAGGRTIFGISSKSWPLLVKELWVLPFDEARQRAREFYKTKYWDTLQCGDLLYPMDIIAFDTSVNIGTIRTIKMLKENEAMFDFLIARIRFYVEISAKENNIIFLRGWINRVLSLYGVITAQSKL